MHRLLARAVAVVFTSASASIGFCQVFSPGDPKILSELNSNLAPVSVVRDSAANPTDGTKYLVGQTTIGSDHDGFLTIVSSHTKFLQHVPVNYGSDDNAVAVALDQSGAVYVCSSSDGTAHLTKLTADGIILWHATGPAYTVPTDMAITSDGRAIVCGSRGEFMTVLAFAADGTSYRECLDDPRVNNEPPFGVATQLTISSAGKIWFTGNGTFANSTFNMVGMIKADLSSYGIQGNSTGTGPRMRDIAVGQNGTIYATGSTVVSSVRQPVRVRSIDSLNADGTVKLTSVFTVATLGSVGGGQDDFVEAVPNSNVVYVLTNTGVTSGSHGFVLNSLTLTTGNSTVNWTLDFTGTSAPTAVGLTLANGLIVVASRNELSQSSPQGPYKAYQLTTIDPGSTIKDHRILGAADQPTPTTFDTATAPVNNLVYGTQSIAFAAPTTSGRAGLWIAGEIEGPADIYKLKEDVAFSATATKDKLLDNDWNFGELGRTCVLVPGSEANVTVSVNPDGSFTAQGLPNFYGIGSFSYEVRYAGESRGIVPVCLDIRPVNDPPVALDDAFSVSEFSRETPLDVLANDSDVDDPELELFGVIEAIGRVKLAPDHKTLLYTPKRHFTGIDTFTYKLRDSGGKVARATVSVTVYTP